MPRVCITVPDQNAQPYRFSLDREVVKIGRAAENDIVIDSASISSYHCEMHRIPGGYVLRDADSTNGIKLDDTAMEAIDLANGLNVYVGDAELEFELTSEETAALSEEEFVSQEQMKLPPAASLSDVALPEAAPAAPEGEPEPGPAAAQQEAPTHRPRPMTRKPLASAKSNAGLQFLVSMLFLALAIASFYFGMAKRHQDVTQSTENPNGRVLYEDLMKKAKGGNDTAVPTSAPTTESEPVTE